MDKKYLDFALEKLEQIISIPSPSGYTSRAADFLIFELKTLGYDPHKTNKGGVTCELGGEGEGLLLGCHVDTLGGMVSRVKPNGRLSISPIGAMSANNTETENVCIITRDGREYSGTFQLESPAFHVNAELDTMVRTFDNMEVVIDEYTRSAEETRELGIEVGDIVAFDTRFRVTPSGYIKSRYLDDKLSSCILLAYAKYLKDTGTVPARKIYIHFTVYEEIGHGASAYAPSDVTEMIAVDMGCVGPDLVCDETMVSICAKDSEGPSSYELVTKLVNTARDKGLNYGIDVYPKYSSDADNVLRAGADIRHCVIGAGVSASHGYERSHIDGLANTFELVKSFIELG